MSRKYFGRLLALAPTRAMRHDGRVNMASQNLPLMSARPAQLLILSTILLLALPGPAAQLYLSTAGSDNNPGTRAKPFATLERARDEARKLRQEGRLSRSGATIWLQGGDLLRTNALQLTAADSGTPNAPIVWRAAKGEDVRLLGGRKLVGLESVADPAILARLPAVAHGHVMQVNLKALGISDFGQMRSRG